MPYIELKVYGQTVILDGGPWPEWGGHVRIASPRIRQWTLQQDGASSHTANNTISYLKRENVSFIELQMWPPNSPDLNHVDYAVWGALQQQI